jgi:cysteine desulfurase family protein
MLYLDNAATSYQKPFRVKWNMAYGTWFWSMNAGRGGHALSLKGAELLLDASDELARLFAIEDASQIAFTYNATYALNMAIQGIVGEDDHVVMTQMEHNSVLRPVHALCDYTVVKANQEGFVDPIDVCKAIRPNTKLIVCTHASNVSGSIQPVEEIGKVAREHGVLFLVDAAQSAGCIPIDVEKMGVDLLAFSGHKGLMGPLGTGGLYVRRGVELCPLIRGGTGSQSESLMQPDFMPDMLQSGTLNTPAIAALGSAARFIRTHSVEAILEKERFLAKRLIEGLCNIPRVKVYGTMDMGMRNGTVSFNLEGLSSGETTEMLNDDYAIAVRGGWHCAYLAHQALGTEKTGTVRASVGYFSRKRDVDRLLSAVSRLQGI